MSDDFETRYARQRELCARANELNKTILFDALTPAGITHIHVEFDGCEDSGQIDDITAWAGEKTVDFPSGNITLHSAEWGQDDLTSKTRPIREAVEDLCYGCLEQTHAGWENNDGAYGEFQIDVAKRTIELEFNGRFTDTWTDTHSF